MVVIQIYSKISQNLSIPILSKKIEKNRKKSKSPIQIEFRSKLAILSKSRVQIEFQVVHFIKFMYSDPPLFKEISIFGHFLLHIVRENTFKNFAKKKVIIIIFHIIIKKNVNFVQNLHKIFDFWIKFSIFLQQNTFLRRHYSYFILFQLIKNNI